MNVYIPNGDVQRRRMLDIIGVDSVEDLLSAVPDAVRIDGDSLDLPPPASELELIAEFHRLEEANTGSGLVCFAGAGAYDHYIPAAIDHILLRSEFFTAYTPYQAEVSQGTLQAIFEYQTMIARLCGTEMANASMYDGATAAAEASLMAIRLTRKERVLVASTLNPRWHEVISTYLGRAGFQLETVPAGPDGLIDSSALHALLEDGAAAMIVQYPSYHGLVEDLRPITEAVHSAGGLLVAAADPVALAMLRSPGSAGADIVVGEGQPMGIPLSYGGPYAGFMATGLKLARKMPGRIIGRTLDRAGETGYVMTMQTREQHIRREKATSNICTNQALMALANTVYLSLVGDIGFREIARQCYHRSHYLEKRLLEVLCGSSRVFGETPFFREFTLRLPVPAADFVDSMADMGILAGVPVPELGPDVILITATEKRTREEIERYAAAAVSLCEEVAG